MEQLVSERYHAGLAMRGFHHRGSLDLQPNERGDAACRAQGSGHRPLAGFATLDRVTLQKGRRSDLGGRAREDGLKEERGKNPEDTRQRNQGARQALLPARRSAPGIDGVSVHSRFLLQACSDNKSPLRYARFPPFIILVLPNNVLNPAVAGLHESVI